MTEIELHNASVIRSTDDVRYRYPEQSVVASVLLGDLTGDQGDQDAGALFRAGWGISTIGDQGVQDAGALFRAGWGISTIGAQPAVQNRNISCRLIFPDEWMVSDQNYLARVGVVRTVSGQPVPMANIILFGNTYREVVETDYRGIWWKYLEIDEYDDATVISYNSMVYYLIEQVEDPPDSCIFYQTVQRGTAVSGPYRMIRRRMV